MLTYLFDDRAELKPSGRKVTWFLVFFYLILLYLMCFSPQSVKSGIETPGIQSFGRIVVLLTPFNSFINFGQLNSPIEIIWVVGQNIANIFLLFPLILGLLALFPTLRKWKTVLLTSFFISLSIETIQILVDILYDANRVFEIDDLWTNTLGGLLAFSTYKVLKKRLQKLR